MNEFVQIDEAWWNILIEHASVNKLLQGPTKLSPQILHREGKEISRIVKP